MGVQLQIPKNANERSVFLKSVSDTMSAVVNDKRMAPPEKANMLFQICNDATLKIAGADTVRNALSSAGTDIGKQMEMLMVLRSPEIKQLRDDIRTEYAKAVKIVSTEAGRDKPLKSFGEFSSGQDRRY